MNLSKMIELKMIKVHFIKIFRLQEAIIRYFKNRQKRV